MTTLYQILIAAGVAGGSTGLGVLVIRPISDRVRARQEAADEAESYQDPVPELPVPTANKADKQALPLPHSDTEHPARAA
ncbi:hypothetical protein [Kitasatospora sp. GP82]|uniref:hypothetical protein n=1 Tax=Kitasatospora sp. GP82 TaxID=3035089 RepID=UPI002477282C|nr:hypothetical protein [Kitasatospora sp. GP82]MDH6129381.1 hypothetical protein [Kitasatospora sp. GP82]